MTIRRFPVGLTAAVIVCMTILIGLGSWQLQRLHWKKGVLEHVAALERAGPQPVAGPLAAAARGEDVGFTRVRITCPGIATAPYLELYGILAGQAGTRLISACPTGDTTYLTLLVDRGFVPDTEATRPPVDASATAPIEVVGVLRTPDPASFATPANDVAANRWFSRDVPAMAAALNARGPAPVFLMAETATNPDLPVLKPAPLPAEISNRHLEYAGTWFGLAAALAGVYAAMLFRRMRD